ncbi:MULTISPECIES: hypothetical protein [unclassified Streptomyces]|uniref:hypothetical protein n=1 Tax=unclassified Streptomyces TaxID=2593676 RepID=UPI0035E07657
MGQSEVLPHPCAIGRALSSRSQITRLSGRPTSAYPRRADYALADDPTFPAFVDKRGAELLYRVVDLTQPPPQVPPARPAVAGPRLGKLR